MEDLNEISSWHNSFHAPRTPKTCNDRTAGAERHLVFAERIAGAKQHQPPGRRRYLYSARDLRIQFERVQLIAELSTLRRLGQ